MERGLALARAGADVVQLAVGEPDFDAPRRGGRGGGARAARGRDALHREPRPARAVPRRSRDDCRAAPRASRSSPERVIVTSGTSPALYMVMRLLLEPGDEVLAAVAALPLLREHGARLRRAPGLRGDLRARDGYAVDPARVRAAITPRTRAIVLASPSNPTGAVQRASGRARAVRARAADPERRDLRRPGLRRRARQPRRSATRRRLLRVRRLLQALRDDRLPARLRDRACTRACGRCSRCSRTCTSARRSSRSAPGSRRSSTARRTSCACARRTTRGARCCSTGLRALGFGVPRAPEGAFYVLADARALRQRLARARARPARARARRRSRPGCDFGPFAEGHLRFSYATSEARIAEGLHRGSTAFALERDQQRRLQRPEEVPVDAWALHLLVLLGLACRPGRSWRRRRCTAGTRINVGAALDQRPADSRASRCPARSRSARRSAPAR